MLTRKLVGLMVSCFFIAATGEWLHAATPLTPEIQIENQRNPNPISTQYTQLGGWTVIHNNGATFSCPSGTTNKYTISGNPTRTGSDSNSPDFIMFHNATITANNPNVCGHIYFWDKVLPGPSGLVDLDLSTNGTLTRVSGGALGSWAHMSGWLQHPSTPQGDTDGISGNWEHAGNLNGPPTSTSGVDKHFNNGLVTQISLLGSAHDDLSGITQSRIMKGELWFLLKNIGDQLKLNDGTGITVQTAAGGGGGGGGHNLCAIIECPDLDLLKNLEKERVMERMELMWEKLQMPPLPPLPEEEPITDKPLKQ